MKYKYKRIYLRSEKDFSNAEKLQAQGWKIISNGFDSIIFEKEDIKK